MGRGSRVEVNEPLQGVRLELRTTHTNHSLKMRPSNEPKPSPFLQDLDLLLEPNTYRSQVLEREPRRQPRRQEPEYRKVRPSALQKMVKKYDGSGDPFDHMAAFRQAVHAEQVSDAHTQIEGFGLTLESKALTWFQTLEPTSKTSLDQLEKDFIGAFSKMGLKHNAVAQIYSFQQKEFESVRDCMSRLCQYVNRCPNDEKPSQGRLISVFLKGLRNKMLHAHLYARKHTTFQECCMDAMDYDDNFEISSVSGIETKSKDSNFRSHKSGTTMESKGPSEERIAELVLQKMGQFRAYHRPQNYAFQPSQGFHKCGKCAGPHRID